MDRNQHTEMKGHKKKKTHATIVSKLIKKFDNLNKAVFEVEKPRHKLNTENVTLLGLSFFETENYKLWNPAPIFSPNFVM